MVLYLSDCDVFLILSRIFLVASVTFSVVKCYPLLPAKRFFFENNSFLLSHFTMALSCLIFSVFDQRLNLEMRKILYLV